MDAPTETPWHAAYPTPRTVAASVSRQELLQWFRDGKGVGRDFVLVYLLRTDFEVRSHALYNKQ
jgi:arsenical-resistance protein 2